MVKTYKYQISIDLGKECIMLRNDTLAVTGIETMGDSLAQLLDNCQAFVETSQGGEGPEYTLHDLSCSWVGDFITELIEAEFEKQNKANHEGKKAIR